MNFRDYYKNRKTPVISFEIFPPKSAVGIENLKETLGELSNLSPDFITVTYGAMGSTREKTIEIASYVKNRLKLNTACHLTCVGSSKKDIKEIVCNILNEGITNIVALRGDPPNGNKEFIPHQNGPAYANELVSQIRSIEKELNKPLGIAIAGYPEKHIEARSFDEDIKNLKKKVDAGADIIITQLFFDNKYYFAYVKKVRAAGIDIPVIPGLMPILSARQIKKISSMCGSKIPEHLINQLNNAGDNNDGAEEIGIAQCIAQARELIDNGVPGIHFYVLNRALHIKRILQSL
ncbi:MAG: methylenetetrahydrofolate reductase [NAD(P)H] [Thermodesulfobacteriota bacterium]